MAKKVKKQICLFMDEQIIKKAKKKAIDEEMDVSTFVEEKLREWVKKK